MPPLSLSVVTCYKILFSPSATSTTSTPVKIGANIKKTSIAALLTLFLGATNYAYADSMSALIAQKSASSQLTAPRAKISTRSTIQRARTNYGSSANPIYTTPSSNAYNYQPPTIAPAVNVTYRYPTNSYPTYSYPDSRQQPPSVLPAFLSGNYDNVDREYLPLLSLAEAQSQQAAREVISTARKMALNERTIIQGGCWDYLDAVFKRAGVTRDTVHKGAYRQGPYASSDEIEIGDWLYYINHGYNGVEHSGLFVGWVDKSAKQALILSYAGESRREPARYRVYDLSNVYQIMRPTI
ncbi:hypothetical protein [uncultured Psychrobacter sp.]|uniref:hypothetical protein n=1 Tax=uncultured Psychrobacter sp. TaxID=259303 RepID=UPI003457FE34